MDTSCRLEEIHRSITPSECILSIYSSYNHYWLYCNTLMDRIVANTSHFVSLLYIVHNTPFQTCEFTINSCWLLSCIKTIRPKTKSLRFLVIGRLQNRCGDTFVFIYYWPTGKYVIHVFTGTKSPIYKVWWLKRGLINRACFHTPRWKSILNHRTVQSIQQFWLQL